jgi:hypothetical protein
MEAEEGVILCIEAASRAILINIMKEYLRIAVDLAKI